MTDGNKDTYDVETIDKAKSAVESFINANFKEVTAIECGEPYESPMGGMVIDAEVNNEAVISLNFDEEFKIGSYSTEDGFPDKKDECKDKVCEY